MEQSIPMSIEELRKKRKQIMKKMETEEKKTSLLGRIALWITEHVGSIILLHLEKQDKMMIDILKHIEKKI